MASGPGACPFRPTSGLDPEVAGEDASLTSRTPAMPTERAPPPPHTHTHRGVLTTLGEASFSRTALGGTLCRMCNKRVRGVARRQRLHKERSSVVLDFPLCSRPLPAPPSSGPRRPSRAKRLAFSTHPSSPTPLTGQSIARLALAERHAGRFLSRSKSVKGQKIKPAGVEVGSPRASRGLEGPRLGGRARGAGRPA